MVVGVVVVVGVLVVAHRNSLDKAAEQQQTEQPVQIQNVFCYGIHYHKVLLLWVVMLVWSVARRNNSINANHYNIIITKYNIIMINYNIIFRNYDVSADINKLHVGFRQVVVNVVVAVVVRQQQQEQQQQH